MPDHTLPALPSDAVVLHIGPHKTGTTAIQGALFNARKALREHGTEYAGPGRQPYLAALYATDRIGRRGDPLPRPKHWRRLLRDVRRASGQRMIISSERFATANDEAIATIVNGIGRDRLHIVVTLRPLAKILPSQWQQFVQNGLRLTYQRWLRHAFNDEPFTPPTPDFWVRHSHGELVRRWSEVAGPGKLTVIVVDDEDHSMLTRSFETLLDLPKGLLVPEQDRTNRSLTYGETEIIRQINEEQAKRDWSDGDYRHFIRRGVTIELKKRTPEPGELAIETPRWAAERAATAAAEAAAQIAKLGVPVMGDLNQLTRLPSAINESTDDPPAPLIPAAAAVAGIVGAVNAGIVGQSAPRKAAGISSDELARPLGNVTTKDLANILADRVKNRAGRAVKAGPKK